MSRAFCASFLFEVCVLSHGCLPLTVNCIHQLGDVTIFPFFFRHFRRYSPTFTSLAVQKSLETTALENPVKIHSPKTPKTLGFCKCPFEPRKFCIPNLAVACITEMRSRRKHRDVGQAARSTCRSFCPV